jgi:hypothetical protein
MSFAATFIVERLHTPVWKTVHDNKGFENLVDIALVGDTFKILEEKVAWYFVKVLTVSDNVGLQCWVCAQSKEGKSLVIEKDGKYYIGQKGVTARRHPRIAKDTRLGKYIINGSEVEILNKKLIKVKVQLCDGRIGYIYTDNGKINQ